MSILDNFDVVGVPRTFSIAEVRILKNRISFNLATASEIGYPPFVRLFISRDKTQIALQPCAKETPNAMKFFTSDSMKDGKPKKRMIPVGNRALTALVKAGIGVEMNVPLKAPGVRFADGDKGDQVRVTTPARAREIGSDYIVVGRPITQAADPVAAYRRCIQEFIG